MKQFPKQIFLLILLSLTFLPSQAQLSNGKQKDLQPIAGSTVYLVLKKENSDGARIYNGLMKSSMEKYWNISKYAFVHADTIDKVILNRNLYFITTFDEEIISNNGFIYVSSIGLIRGGKLFSKYKHTEELAWVYIRKNTEDYAARIPNMVQELQYAVKWTANPTNKKMDIYTSFNKQAVMKDKVLYIEKKDLSEKNVDMEKLEKNYKYPVKIVDTEELRAAIERQDEKVVYMQLTNNRNSSCFFIAAKGGEVVWEHQASINTQVQLINYSVLEHFKLAIDAALADAK